jgi:hypothetical protein
MRPVSTVLRGLAVLACAAVLAACASTDYHYSQLVGKRYYRAPIDTYSVSILRVDGKDWLRTPVLVDPGLRQITVQGPPGGTGAPGLERDISLDVRPCMRYYLVAYRPNRLASDFTVRVDYEEPVSGCTPPVASASRSG